MKFLWNVDKKTMFGYIRARALPSVNGMSLKLQLLSSLTVGVTWMGLAYSGYSRICRNATPCLGYWHKRSNTPALLGPSSVSMLTTALVYMLNTALQMSTNALLWSKVMHYLITVSRVVQCYAISYFSLNLQKLIFDRWFACPACTSSEKICLF